MVNNGKTPAVGTTDIEQYTAVIERLNICGNPHKYGYIVCHFDTEYVSILIRVDNSTAPQTRYLVPRSIRLSLSSLVAFESKAVCRWAWANASALNVNAEKNPVRSRSQDRQEWQRVSVEIKFSFGLLTSLFQEDFNWIWPLLLFGRNALCTAVSSFHCYYGRAERDGQASQVWQESMPQAGRTPLAPLSVVAYS